MASRVECFYGQSGTGKSEGAASVIERIYEMDGLTSRVIVGDGSKATYLDRGLIDAGVVEIVDFSIRDWPLTTMQQLTEGFWPEDVNDPKSPLKPPTADSLKRLGVFVVEGLSVGAQYIMGDRRGGLAEQASRGIKIGQDSPVFAVDALLDKNGQPIKDSGPGTTFGGNPIAHFAFAQRRLSSYIERTKVFPNIVIWTAHERSTEDKISKEKLVGPEAAGEAMTANLPRVFNNTLHFTTASKKKDKVKDAHSEAMVTDLDVEFRVYTRDHFNPDGNGFIKYKAVTRGVSEEEGMPLYLTSDTPGQAVLDFYDRVKSVRDKRIARLAGLKGEATAITVADSTLGKLLKDVA